MVTKSKKSKPSTSDRKSGGDRGSSTSGRMDDWISSLAKQVSGESTSGQPQQQPTRTKEERIQKRAVQKAQKQQQQEIKSQQRQQQRHPDGEGTRSHPTKTKKNSMMIPHKKTKTTDTELVKRRLKRMAQWMVTLQREHEENKQQQGGRGGGGRYSPPADQDRVGRIRALNEQNLQPRTCDYSGIGLARKSLFIPFQDPSHIPKLTQEFNEHIPGFFGRQRTKAMKRQLDGNMLWRKLANHKLQQQQTEGSGGGGGSSNGGLLPKKFANLSPDDRVQAMIDAGMI